MLFALVFIIERREAPLAEVIVDFQSYTCVPIARYLCRKKGPVEHSHKTFSLLPSFLVPYHKEVAPLALDQYHRKIHQGIGQPPLDRFLDDMKNVQVRRISPDELEQFFYQTVHRLVKNDSTVSINSILFEVPAKYIGSKIEIRYPFDQLCELYLYENDKPVCKCQRN